MAEDFAIVLVTGGSGFLGTHLIFQLLNAGYTVRATVRSIDREPEVRNTLQRAGAKNLNRLTFIAADLCSDDHWADAVKGCTYVQHVASPFPAAEPKSADELIVPAREGTLRVLRAARDSGTVKRVVVTGSFAAVAYGHPKGRTEVFTEKDWTVLDGDVAIPAYHKSKTLAEKAAWEMIDKEGRGLELTAVNATGIFGPVLGKNFSASIGLVKSLLGGTMPAAPKLYFTVVDVRDLAEFHIKAMVAPEAKGERYIAAGSGEPTPLLGLAKIIREGRPEKAGKVPSKEFPNWVLRVVALWDGTIKGMLPQLGEIRWLNNDKAKRLGWKPRPLQDTVLDTVDSLFEHGVMS